MVWPRDKLLQIPRNGKPRRSGVPECYLTLELRCFASPYDYRVTSQVPVILNGTPPRSSPVPTNDPSSFTVSEVMAAL